MCVCCQGSELGQQEDETETLHGGLINSLRCLHCSLDDAYRQAVVMLSLYWSPESFENVARSCCDKEVRFAKLSENTTIDIDPDLGQTLFIRCSCV